jgi:1,4-dihydroxy-2-naphthoyl-CoA hydrolase
MSATDDEVHGRVTVRPDLKQPAGLLHGGVLAAMAESLASMATFLGVQEDGKVVMGQSNATSFLRPITEGTVHAVARRRHRGRTTWVWDVDFTDDAGRLCATTRMTIAVRELPRQ